MGSRLRPLTKDKPKALVVVAGRAILNHCFDHLIEVGADQLLVVVVGYRKEKIIDFYGDEYEGVSITYTHQWEPKGLVHTLLIGEEYIDDDFMLMLGDNAFDANLADVVNRQHEDRVDAAFLVEQIPYDEASRYGVLKTNDYGKIVEVVEKPDDPPTNLVMTRFYTFTPGIFHAWHLVQPSDRGKYELSDAVDLLVQSGRTIDALRMDGWCIDVRYPEDHEEAERWLEQVYEPKPGEATALSE